MKNRLFLLLGIVSCSFGGYHGSVCAAMTVISNNTMIVNSHGGNLNVQTLTRDVNNRFDSVENQLNSLRNSAQGCVDDLYDNIGKHDSRLAEVNQQLQELTNHCKANRQKIDSLNANNKKSVDDYKKGLAELNQKLKELRGSVENYKKDSARISSSHETKLDQL